MPVRCHSVRLTERFPGCFNDQRKAELVEHAVSTPAMQRGIGIALGYEDLKGPIVRFRTA